MSDIQDRLVPIDLETEVKKSFIAYSMTVIVSRALPDVRDGMKPVHRRILYAMNELGMTPDKPTRKCARIVGDVLGKYHPHGDSSVYGALVRLAQDFNIRYPLVDGQGNFGSVDGDGAAAMRYTEARMSRLSQFMLSDINKDTVDFYPNFDGTLQQPSVLPSRFPNLLVNGSSGIAVGMATNIPPHNLGEAIDAVIALMDNPDITLEELMEHMPGPDFPTGGIILGTSGIKEAYYTGRGRIFVRAKAEIETLPNDRERIIVTEIPYMVNKSKLIIRMAELVHDKRIEGISDIRDESDREGMRIVIDLKRDAQPQVVLNHLYKHTQMQDTFGVIMLALVNNQPRVLNLKEMLSYYIDHQIEVVTRRTQFDLDKAKARAHIVEGLLKALSIIDEVVQTIRSSGDTATAKMNLMDRFDFSERQAQAILDMRLARLTNLEMDKLQEEFDQIQKDITRYELILSDRDELNGVIKEEILTIRNRYSDKRRTEISPVEREIDIEALIPVDEMVVTMTHFGYVKRLSESTYRAQNRGGRGVSALTTRAEDYVEQMYVVNSHSDMLFFTDHGRAFGMKCYEIPEAGRQARGTAIVNLLQLQGGEKVNMMLPVPDRHGDDYLVMATRNGIIKKTALSEFINMRKTGLIAINLIEDDSLIGVALTDGKSDIMLATSEGKAIRFHENDVRPTGRATQGVRSMRLTEGDYIVSMGVVEEDKQVLTVSEDGYGKRTLPEEFNAQRRGGQGVIAMHLSEKTGKLAAMLFVDEEDEVMMITDEGIMIRTPVSDIRICGRATQGVRMMRVDEGGRIVDVDTIAKEDDDELEHDEHHQETSHLSDEEYQSFDDMDEEASEDLEEDLE